MIFKLRLINILRKTHINLKPIIKLKIILINKITHKVIFTEIINILKQMFINLKVVIMHKIILINKITHKVTIIQIKINILNYLSISVKMSNKDIHQRISLLVKLYFNHIYLSSINYKDILNFYQYIIINCKPSLTPYNYISITTEFLKNILSLLRFKFGLKNRIKNWLFWVYGE